MLEISAQLNSMDQLKRTFPFCSGWVALPQPRSRTRWRRIRAARVRARASERISVMVFGKCMAKTTSINMRHDRHLPRFGGANLISGGAAAAVDFRHAAHRHVRAYRQIEQDDLDNMVRTAARCGRPWRPGTDKG
jgi:hypothetical protein